MDKEMRAKIDEFLKTNSKRELSMDEMVQVSGGADYPQSLDVLDIHIHDDASMCQFVDLIASLEQTMGKPVVENLLEDMCPTQLGIISAYKKGGINEMRYCIYTILNS